MPKLTAIDLFAGAGGATQGLVDADFSVLAAVESDPVAARSYRSNHDDVHLVEGDICDTDPERLRLELGIARGRLTMLKACPPCQGYSSIGKGDPADARNDLVAEVWPFVRAFRPRVVLLENVPGLARDERLSRLSKDVHRRRDRVRRSAEKAPSDRGCRSRRSARVSRLARRASPGLVRRGSHTDGRRSSCARRERRSRGRPVASAAPLVARRGASTRSDSRGRKQVRPSGGASPRVPLEARTT